jgi:type II secretory pathway pseudopilin PulG
MQRSTRRAFTLYQLLVLLALLVLFAAFLFPVIARARQAAARTQSANNLKILGIGVHAYNDSFGLLPPGHDDNHFSVTARLLPFIEQDALYKTIDFQKSIDDPANRTPRTIFIPHLVAPLDQQMTVNEYGPTNYLWNAGTKAALAGNDGAFYHNSKAKLTTTFKDGLSNTIMVVETLKGDGKKEAKDVRRQHVALKAAALKGLDEKAGVQDFKENKNIAADRCASWMDGRFLQGTFNAGRAPNDEKPDVSCEGQGGWSGPRSLTDTIQVGLGDGSVRAIDARKISLKTWTHAITPAGGEVLGDDW